jgi:hypothetical protein
LKLEEIEMSFKPSRKGIILLGLLSVFIMIMGYVSYKEIDKMLNNNTPSPSSSPIPTEYTNNSSSVPLVTSYTVTIPEIHKVGFGVAEINLKFIAPSPSLQKEMNISEQNFTTTILPITLSTDSNNATNSILPAIFNGTTIEIKVDVYQYTMIVDNPRILVASEEWNVTEYKCT